MSAAYIKLTYPEVAWILKKLTLGSRYFIKDLRDISYLLISKFRDIPDIKEKDVDQVEFDVSLINDNILKQQAILDHFLGQSVIKLG